MCVQVNTPMAESVASNNCGDGLDNDCDGLIDTNDPGCVVVPSEANCFDGLDDDDGDGAIDCADSDCANVQDGACDTGMPGICAEGTRTCQGGTEMCVQVNNPTAESTALGNCNDGMDNDCDGDTDAADADCGPTVDKHISPNRFCTSCHFANVQDLHRKDDGTPDCGVCHGDPFSTIPSFTTDCVNCHTTGAPHALDCMICHEDKRISDYRGEGQKIHKKHGDKVVCGICHTIPEGPRDPGNPDDCTLCHKYKSVKSAKKLQIVHKNHMKKFKNKPNPCFWCHDPVPALDVRLDRGTLCTLCHKMKSARKSASLSRIHDKHTKKYDCTACHQSVADFPDVREVGRSAVCTVCHKVRNDSSVKVHNKHLKKASCYSCHGDSDVYASWRGDEDCTICHSPRDDSFQKIHEKHASDGTAMCIVCHSVDRPDVKGIDIMFTGSFERPLADPAGSGGGSIDLSTGASGGGASGGGCSVVGAGGGWKEAAGSYGLLFLVWLGLALRRRKPETGN
jgi:hypothetical protein